MLSTKQKTFTHFQDGRTPLHYASVMAGSVFGMQSTCYDMLVDVNANDCLVDHEGYTPANFFRLPKLVDMDQVLGLNQCSGLEKLMNEVEKFPKILAK